MPNSRTVMPSTKRIPPICWALDHTMTERAWTTTALTAALQLNNTSVVSRWRNGINVPDRDMVARIEAIIVPEMPLGYLSRLAGYVEDPTASDGVDQFIAWLKRNPRLTEAYRQTLPAMVALMVEEAFRASAEELGRIRPEPGDDRSGLQAIDAEPHGSSTP